MGFLTKLFSGKSKGNTKLEKITTTNSQPNTIYAPFKGTVIPLEQINDGVDGILCGFTPAGIADGIEKLITNPALATKFRMASAEKQINHLEELQNIYGMMR